VIPEDLKYTSEHEWLREPGQAEGSVRVGITDFAQESLGDIVFVQLPDPDAATGAGEPIGEIESTKSVSDLYAPVAGTVTARNDALEDRPELVNIDPYGEGWIIEMRLDGPDPLAALLDATAYEKLITQA
jgi:glycine cleavage system H protein